MTKTFRPEFDRYHSGPWPYERYLGVGVALSGYPTDPHRFIDILQSHSCSPSATRRILDELEAGKTKLTTVSDFLPFNRIGDDLVDIGVSMQIVPPHGVPPDQRFDLAALEMIKGRSPDLTAFTDDEKSRVLLVRDQVLRSMTRIPHELGAYA